MFDSRLYAAVALAERSRRERIERMRLRRFDAPGIPPESAAQLGLSIGLSVALWPRLKVMIEDAVAAGNPGQAYRWPLLHGVAVRTYYAAKVTKSGDDEVWDPDDAELLDVLVVLSPIEGTTELLPTRFAVGAERPRRPLDRSTHESLIDACHAYGGAGVFLLPVAAAKDAEHPFWGGEELRRQLEVNLSRHRRFLGLPEGRRRTNAPAGGWNGRGISLAVAASKLEFPTADTLRGRLRRVTPDDPLWDFRKDGPARVKGKFREDAVDAHVADEAAAASLVQRRAKDERATRAERLIER